MLVRVVYYSLDLFSLYFFQCLQWIYDKVMHICSDILPKNSLKKSKKLLNGVKERGVGGIVYNVELG